MKNEKPKQKTGNRRMPKKEAYHHGNLREALVDAAIDILESEGLKSLSLREVARRVGVSQTAPYHHFKDKEGMLAAVAAKGFLMMGAEQTKQAEATGMEALGKGYVDFALKHPALLQIMFGPEISNPNSHADLKAAGDQSFQSIFKSVTDQMEKAGIDYITPSVVTISAWALVHGLAILLIGGKISPKTVGLKDKDELVEQVAKVLVRGLA